MASLAQIVSEMLEEFGTTGIEISNRLTKVVGEITIDILLQNGGRFNRLEKTTTITFDTSTTAYILPVDFNTIKGHAVMVDSDGDFIKEVEVVSESEFYRRKGDTGYSGTGYFYIEDRDSGVSPGQYIVLNVAADAVSYLKVFYYRVPTENDTDIIKNTRIVKEGVRGSFPQFVPQALNSLTIYERMKSGIKESASDRATEIVLTPAKRVMKFNRFMHKIARGG